ncbi:uncharacterized protein J7T54_004822 [Emericellopsis cladophorae]|uniref:Uncharacterized protein n=1 Tax=Emericellopsis cladophorae TaxID=2686198 RepID=A0A9P9Y6E9_9HYPO|nr:uncharacterized protein J7T54_004822 [Emericellopsis cladophorae]KAI6784276.1 hypothetical protein J7T54_004822 [Emericellopsis cladophorae]
MTNFSKGFYGVVSSEIWCDPVPDKEGEYPSSEAQAEGTEENAVRFLKSAASDSPDGDLELNFVKRRTLDEQPVWPVTSSSTASPFSQEAKKLARSFGFLYDCDGVLHLGDQKIRSAKSALRLCRDHDSRYLFLTNGGGNTTEEQKAASLKKKVGIDGVDDLIGDRVIQSHTPLRKFRTQAKEDETIYITSLDPERARNIAHSYGFRNVITSTDLLEQYEHIYPFAPKHIFNSKGRALPNATKLWRGTDAMAYDAAELKNGNYLKIDHVFIFNDPRDWSLETQIIHDILASHQGYLGTLSHKNGDKSLENGGWQQDGQPKVWISNLDLLWKTEHPINRFGTGAFLHAFRGVWKESTGHELLFKYMGKPSRITYEYAHDSLLRANGAADGRTEPLRRVYMIGDNPESDVRGALEFQPEDGTEYVPILVKTGVWRQTEAERQPRWEPAVIVNDVLDAVVWAMRNEGIDVTREAVEKM